MATVARNPERNPLSPSSEEGLPLSFLTAHAGPSPQQEAHEDSSRPWFHNQDMPGLEMALSLLFLRPILHLSLSLSPLCSYSALRQAEISHPKLLVVSQPGQGIAANPTAPLHHPETVVSRAADPDRRGWGLALHSRAQTTWRPVAPPTSSSPRSGLSAGLQVAWPSWPFSLPHPVPPTEFMPTLGHLLGTDPHTLSRLTRGESRPARLTLACWLITSL